MLSQIEVVRENMCRLQAAIVSEKLGYCLPFIDISASDVITAVNSVIRFSGITNRKSVRVLTGFLILSHSRCSIFDKLRFLY